MVYSNLSTLSKYKKMSEVRKGTDQLIKASAASQEHVDQPQKNRPNLSASPMLLFWKRQRPPRKRRAAGKTSREEKERGWRTVEERLLLTPRTDGPAVEGRIERVGLIGSGCCVSKGIFSTLGKVQFRVLSEAAMLIPVSCIFQQSISCSVGAVKRRRNNEEKNPTTPKQDLMNTTWLRIFINFYSRSPRQQTWYM